MASYWVANFINGEFWGRVTNVPWAVIFPRSAPSGTPIELIAARHPSQLYEALLEGLLLGIFAWWRFGYTDARQIPVRLTGEQFREPDANLIFGLSCGIFYSIFILIAGAAILVLASARGSDKSEPAIRSQMYRKIEKNA